MCHSQDKNGTTSVSKSGQKQFDSCTQIRTKWYDFCIQFRTKWYDFCIQVRTETILLLHLSQKYLYNHLYSTDAYLHHISSFLQYFMHNSGFKFCMQPPVFINKFRELQMQHCQLLLKQQVLTFAVNSK